MTLTEALEAASPHHLWTLCEDTGGPNPEYENLGTSTIRLEVGSAMPIPRVLAVCPDHPDVTACSGSLFEWNPPT